jgi:MFS family permease
LAIPLGTGAAQNLFSSIAGDWRAPAGLVALITGALSGLVSIPFSLIGGYIGDLWDRKSAYLLGGGLMAICAMAMAMAAKTPQNFVIFALLYAATMGVVWGAYGGVVYEAAGGGAAATKCNILSSLCNIPIAVMVAVDGWAHTRWGSVGMLVNEAGIGAIAIVIFIAVRIATAPRAANAFA